MDKEKKEEKKIAAAIKYDIEADSAPKILAAGKGRVAEEILKIAEEHQVPLYEDKQLANLLASLEIETEIPADLYVLVAEVLSFVYKLDRMKKKKKHIESKMEQLKKDNPFD